MSRSASSDERSIASLYETLERFENPRARFHVRQAIQLEIAESQE